MYNSPYRDGTIEPCRTLFSTARIQPRVLKRSLSQSVWCQNHGVYFCHLHNFFHPSWSLLYTSGGRWFSPCQVYQWDHYSTQGIVRQVGPVRQYWAVTDHNSCASDRSLNDLFSDQHGGKRVKLRPLFHKLKRMIRYNRKIYSANYLCCIILDYVILLAVDRMCKLVGWISSPVNPVLSPPKAACAICRLMCHKGTVPNI